MNTNNVSVSRELLERVRNIMAFHASRCPITPLSNYGGTEEHCAEYRNVFADVKQALAQPSEQPAKVEQPGDVGLYEAANGALSMLGYLLNHLPEGSRDNTAYMNLREELKSRGALRHGL